MLPYLLIFSDSTCQLPNLNSSAILSGWVHLLHLQSLISILYLPTPVCPSFLIPANSEKLLTCALLTWASQVTLVVKNLPANVRDMRDVGLIPGLERSPWRRAWQPTPVFSRGESPWIEEPGGLQARGLQRIRHSWRDLAHTHGYTGFGSLVVAT